MARIKLEDARAEWENFLRGLGERVRRFRSEKHMTQRDLANAAGTTPSYIYQIEVGKQNISLELLWSIANGLDLPLELLFSGDAIWEEPTDKSVRQLSAAVAALKAEIVEGKAREEELLKKAERLNIVSEKLMSKFPGETNT